MCKRFVLEAHSIFLRISAHSMVVCTNMKTIPFSCLTSKNLHLGIQSSDTVSYTHLTLPTIYSV